MREGQLVTGKRDATTESCHTVHVDRETPMRFKDIWFQEKLALFDRETRASPQAIHKKPAVKSGINTSDS